MGLIYQADLKAGEPEQLSDDFQERSSQDLPTSSPKLSTVRTTIYRLMDSLLPPNKTR
jgi:hypothetical protein